MILESSNNWSTNSVSSPAKFNQVLNVFSLESREIRRTAQHLWSWDAQTVAQQVSLGKLKQLLNICVLGKLKQLTNGFGPESWLLQTTADLFWTRVLEFQATAQRFRSWVLRRSNKFSTLIFLISSMNCQRFAIQVFGSSKNCTTILVSGSSKNSPTVLIWVIGNSNNCATLVVLGSSNNCPTVFDSGRGKFKQVPNGFIHYSWELQTAAEMFWFRVLCGSWAEQKFPKGFNFGSLENETIDQLSSLEYWEAQTTSQH